MKAKFIKLEYTTEKLDSYINNKIKIPNLINHA